MQLHYPHFPPLLHGIAILSLIIAGLCAVIIAADEIRRPQPMAVMNLVWPLTALFGSLLWLAVYCRWGHIKKDDTRKPPFAVAVLKGSSHCGAGCTLGDIIMEWCAVMVPSVASWFGWGWLFHEKTFAIWIPDFLLAFLLGIAFQYFSIQPMRHLPPGQALLTAVKADIASISAWQAGMYGVMALIQFGWLRHDFGAIAPVQSPEFWFAMQLAMLGGFVAAYPVNWLLIRGGWKEEM